MGISGAMNQSFWILGVEGGGTRTSALWARLDQQGTCQVARTAEFGPGNIRLLSDSGVTNLLREIADRSEEVTEGETLAGAGIALAGARALDQRSRLDSIAKSVWPNLPLQTSHDLESAWLAGDWESESGSNPELSANIPRILTLSGTGSCVYGKNSDGAEFKIGGWGHLLGDKGSAYDVGLRALKAVLYYLDRDGKWEGLGPRILRRLQLNEPIQLVEWIQSAGKDAVADIAREVMDAAEISDKIALDILKGAASSLAKDSLSCVSNVTGKQPLDPLEPFEIILAGGMLLKSPRLATLFTSEIQEKHPAARILPLTRESVWGSVALGLKAAKGSGVPRHINGPTTKPASSAGYKIPEGSIPRSTSLSPTECRNPRSMQLDSMPLSEAVQLMIQEDRFITAALEKCSSEIEALTLAVINTFGSGGRLFYSGAGTSGRLGVLDASECPPTFRAHPEQVQGIIAGGQKAIWSAVEGAEDDFGAGMEAVAGRGLTQKDLLIGIASSGRTPFVWGSIHAAKKIGARTGFICFNPYLEIDAEYRPDYWIAPNLEPELLTGSTRLKSGTATKMILNILTTLGMVRNGKALSNLMVDLNPSNVKLRQRAIRIVRELTQVDETSAKEALEEQGWIVKAAVEQLLQFKKSN